jgi:hypothetical protein
LADDSKDKLASELLFGRGAPLVSNIVFNNGQWRRVGPTWDRSVKILYVVDAEVASDAVTTFKSSKDDMYIGVDKDLTPGFFFSDMIGDVRIYNRTVTP